MIGSLPGLLLFAGLGVLAGGWACWRRGAGREVADVMPRYTRPSDYRTVTVPPTVPKSFAQRVNARVRMTLAHALETGSPPGWLRRVANYLNQPVPFWVAALVVILAHAPYPVIVYAGALALLVRFSRGLGRGVAAGWERMWRRREC